MESLFLPYFSQEIESWLGVPSPGDHPFKPAHVPSSLCCHELDVGVGGQLLVRHRRIADDGVILGSHQKGLELQPFDVLRRDVVTGE